MLCAEWPDSLGAPGPEIMTADLQPDGKKTCCLFCVLQENFRKVEGLLPYTIHPGRRLDQDSILL